ncbi:MAG: hypothetical protein NTY42_11060 [Planctomycetota bacterium]|nr:hypothetical protein [Planctomycetota bacterium]
MYKLSMMACVLALLCCNKHSAQAQEATRHSLFIAGPDFTGILNEDGTEKWNAGRKAARDGYVLDNGNVLIAWSDEVKEINPQENDTVVFHYRLSAVNKEIGTAQRLSNGNTLIAELGKEPKLLEITTDGTVAVTVNLKPETDNAHMQTRMARKLANGNYLVPHLLAFNVKEYNSQGEVIRVLKTDLESLGGRAAENWPFTAIRLENGNTLVNLTHGNKTVEFDEAGNIVWKISNADFPDLKPFDDPCGGQRLPNGNTVITSYHATKGIKVFEVTRDKKMVWKYDGPYRAHEFQVLTTNGVKLPVPPMK